MKRVSILFFLSILVFPPVYSYGEKESWTPKSCEVSDKELAQELLKMLISGYELSLDTIPYNPCMKQSDYQWTRVSSANSQVIHDGKNHLLKEADQAEIVGLKSGRRGNVEVSVKVKVNEKGKNTPLESLFIMKRFESKTLQARYGCGTIVVPPREHFMLESCYESTRKNLPGKRETKK